MRYAIRIDPLWRPVLLLGGATREASYVDLMDDRLRFRFGVFDETVPLEEISQGHHAVWSLLRGIGWRIGPKKSIGLIGSTQGVVEVRFRTPRRLRFFFVPMRRGRIYVSLETPEDFLDNLRSRTALLASEGQQSTSE